MSIKLYNSLTRAKEELKPRDGRKVTIYACGPTVYDYFHIGNARVFIFFDLVRRYLQYRGFEVTYVQNFTDIDDKMINRAAELGMSVNDLAERFINAYHEDARALGIWPADFHPRATAHIPQMTKFIQSLLNAGMAYNVQGDIYFDTSKFKDYGKLSQQRLEDLEAGSRVDVDPRKRYPLDFVLWKKQKPGEPAWDSPWGKGRPGWHIECSVMAMHYLGETIDIHAGGQDLIFPHHENEIAQSEGVTGKPFARYWMHVGYLKINKQKMSKSLGNFFTVRDLLSKYDPKLLRFIMFSVHYRHPFNFNEELLEQARAGLHRLNLLLFKIRDRLQKGVKDNGDHELIEKIGITRVKIIEAMDDDFNTADALAALFILGREANTYLDHSSLHSKRVLKALLDLIQEVDRVFGIFDLSGETAPLEEEIEQLIKKRQEARRNKDFGQADHIRNKLRSKGVILEDTPQSTRWRLKNKSSKMEEGEQC